MNTSLIIYPPVETFPWPAEVVAATEREVISMAASTVAESAALASGATAEAAAASAAAAVEAVEGGATLCVGLNAAATALGVVGIIMTPFIIVMTQREQVTIVIENATSLEWRQSDIYMDHGKQTAQPTNNLVPAMTNNMDPIKKLFHATYVFSKKDGAMFGTEGAFILSAGANNIAIAWKVPISGKNGCAVAYGYTSAESAWQDLINTRDPQRTSTTAGHARVVVEPSQPHHIIVEAGMHSTSGGDVAMLVSIKIS